jgi:UDP-glucuronate 4-epimerase
MILVTGGAGFIGSHLVDRLLDRDLEVICLDDFNDFYDPAIKRSNIAGHLASSKYRLVQSDIRDKQRLVQVFREYSVTKIIHLAARAGVRQSLEEPFLYEDVNIKGTMNLLELARLHRVGHFIFASSSSVYGANSKVPFCEGDRIDRTVSPYAATKYSGELMCYTYHHLYGVPTTCLRFFTVYGPRQRPEMAIYKFTQAIYAGKPIPFFGNGSTARDYTYIDDIINGVLAAMDHPFPFEVFNLGESTTVTLGQLVDQLERISGRTAVLKKMPMQPGDVEITYADVSKARQLLGYNPSVSISEGLAKFIEWFEEKEPVGRTSSLWNSR